VIVQNPARLAFVSHSSYFAAVNLRPAASTAPVPNFDFRFSFLNLGISSPILPALCFHGLTNCFSRNSLVFKTFCVAPGVYRPISFQGKKK